MENKYLISKWLNGELKGPELLDFKKTKDYQAYQKIIEEASNLKVPNFDQQKGLEDIWIKIRSR